MPDYVYDGMVVLRRDTVDGVRHRASVGRCRYKQSQLNQATAPSFAASGRLDAEDEDGDKGERGHDPTKGQR